MTTAIPEIVRCEGTHKERAISALVACGFREIGHDGSGLRLFKSSSGALLIGVGSCRCLAYSPTGPDGRLQLVAASRTAALLCRITALDTTPLSYFPIQAGDSDPLALPVSAPSSRPASAARPPGPAVRHAAILESLPEWPEAVPERLRAFA